LIGRAEERAVIDRLLDGARAGRSGVLLLRGDPGVGKSALLAYAVSAAADLCVLRAHGVESESELDFSGLHELVAPALGRLDELPEPQAEALRGALRLAPAFEVDRFAVAAATLGLLAAVADRGSVLVALDDVQWLDHASADAIAFAARRLGAEGVVLLGTLVEGAESPLSKARFPELTVPGLDAAAARELLGDGKPERVAPRVAEELVAATGGNTLALAELAPGLTADQLAGTAPLGDRLPSGRAIEVAFARRLAPLGDAARTALLVVAASESGRVDVIVPAAATLAAGEGAFEAVEAAGLLRIEGGRVTLRHPLLRSAVYSAAPAAARRAAHHALAGAIADEDDPERVWHEAAATIAPAERVAAALERTAESARRRGGHAAAARALERAAQLTPPGDTRASRLLAAGESARRAGRSWARELLDEARSEATDPLLRFDVELKRAAVEVWSGSVVAAAQRYVDSADRLDPADPERQVRALSFGAACWGVAGELRKGVDTARRAVALATPQVGESTQLLAREALGSLLVECGETDEGRALVLEAAASYERHHEPVDSDFVALALLWLEEHGLARRLIEPLVSSARRASDLRLLASALELSAELAFRTGIWDSAATAASESAQLAEATGETTQLAYSLAVQATIEAARGDEACRAHAARAADLAQRGGVAAVSEHVDYALGLLELGLGNGEPAIAALERAAAASARAGRGEPGVFPWGADLVESYLIAGRAEDAFRATERFEDAATATGRAWARAAALRCRGLLAPDAELDVPFAAALAAHGRTEAPFQLARTELAYGRRLRRARRRVRAREQLRRAATTFERLGARPWLEATRRELAASGETLRAATPDARDLLTPQELQIARLVGDGMTNREVASSLFLSPKTIESHLQNAYRKLGVHSRTQLSKRLAAGDAS
jgi:DNA-binding CsgD family transcriptional regulator